MAPNDLEPQTTPLARPYRLTRSRLGVTSQVFNEVFVCTLQRLHALNEIVQTKLATISPNSEHFQYLLSFEDRTHVDHYDLVDLENLVNTTDKVTERLVLKWAVTHEMDDETNEVTVTVRISNPVNPLLMLQAALSKSPDDIDNFEFEDGSVVVSIDGVGQTFAQEVFEAVGRWINSCPKPEATSKTSVLLSNNRRLIQWSNYWLLPLLVATGFFAFLLKQNSLILVASLTFLGIVGHTYLRNLAHTANQKIDHWVHKSQRLSLFNLTGGDANQQNRIAVRAQTSTNKVLATAIGSVFLDLVAAIAASYLGFYLP